MPTTTKYIWADDNYLAEADGNDTINVVYTNEPQQYGNLVSTRISSTTSYHHFDAIGSTRQLTNSGGAITDSVVYDSWGNIVNRTGITPVSFLWTGVEGYYFDAQTGLAYVRARTYSAAIARWTTRDPVLILAVLSPYGYVLNRPIVQTDPSGAFFTCLFLPSCGLSDFPKPTVFERCDIFDYTPLNAKKSQPMYGSQFEISAKFYNGGGAICFCCEYRQLLTVTRSVRVRTKNAKGTWVPLNKLTPYGPQITDLTEDGTTAGLEGLSYGHRNGTNTRDDEYTPKPRISGCNYHASDSPGIALTVGPNFLAGNAYEIVAKYKFVAQIYDICQARVVKQHEMEFDCCGVISYNKNTKEFKEENDLEPKCGAGN